MIGQMRPKRVHVLLQIRHPGNRQSLHDRHSTSKGKHNEEDLYELATSSKSGWQAGKMDYSVFDSVGINGYISRGRSGARHQLSCREPYRDERGWECPY